METNGKSFNEGDFGKICLLFRQVSGFNVDKKTEKLHLRYGYGAGALKVKSDS